MPLPPNKEDIVMNTIEIENAVARSSFMKYLSTFLKEDISCSPDIKNFLLIFNNEETSNVGIAPSYGEFHWIDKIKNNEFVVSYIEEGNPVGTSMELSGVVYFKRMKVSHPNLDILKEFIERAIEYKEKKENKKILVYRSSSKGYFENCGKVYAQDIDNNVYIPKDIKNSLISHIENFISPKTKERYLKYGRIYKTSIMLTGVPGSGKTSIVKAIASKYDRPVYVFNFTKELNDEGLINLMREIKNDSIILFEDIDAFFVDREPQKINISFSALLNVMDGIYGSTSGCITFITANNPDRLDSALIRPGRVDKIIKFDYPRKSEIKQAFDDMVEPDPNTNAPPVNFEEFYSHIKIIKITMAGIIDYLFRYYYDNLYITKINELIEQNQIYHDIINDKCDKLYS